MFSRMQQASRQLARMRKLKRQIESLEREGTAGAGMVKVRMNGARMVRRVTIEPEVFKSGDAELLEELVKAAINDASRKIERELAQQVRSAGGPLAGLTDGP